MVFIFLLKKTKLKREISPAAFFLLRPPGSKKTDGPLLFSGQTLFPRRSTPVRISQPVLSPTSFWRSGAGKQMSHGSVQTLPKGNVGGDGDGGLAVGGAQKRTAAKALLSLL